MGLPVSLEGTSEENDCVLAWKEVVAAFFGLLFACLEVSGLEDWLFRSMGTLTRPLSGAIRSAGLWMPRRRSS